jgi:hypothetical protein
MSRIWEPGKATTPIRRELLFEGACFIASMLGNWRDWRNDIHRRISAIEGARWRNKRWDHIVLLMSCA